MMQAITLYRRLFVPSPALAKPYVAIGVPLVAAPTDAQADYLASSIYQRVLGIVTGDRKLLQPPVAQFLENLGERERQAIASFLSIAVIGGPDTVAAGFKQLQTATGADEFILVCDVFEPGMRLRSLEIAQQAMAGL